MLFKKLSTIKPAVFAHCQTKGQGFTTLMKKRVVFAFN
jgi:hypothetical protein